MTRRALMVGAVVATSLSLAGCGGSAEPSTAESEPAAGSDSGFNLDVVFSTTEGRDLAIATSHTLTVPIVDYTTTECGLSFDDES